MSDSIDFQTKRIQIAAIIDYATLEIVPETFVDETLRRSQVAALFRVQCGEEDLLIYILVEQQSKPDHAMPTRRLLYKTRPYILMPT